MDEALENSWKKNTKPFNGYTITSYEDFIETDLLKKVVSSIVDFLSNNNMLLKLYRNEDWHEHDGYINSSKETNEEELREFINSGLNKFFSEGDNYVRILFYNSNDDFIFRIYCNVDNTDESEFDITLSKEFAEELKDKLEKEFDLKLDLKISKEFFDEIYAG